MTRIEQSELGMTPEALEERRSEVEAKLHAEQDWVATSSPGRLNAAPDNGRKKRSDAGLKKGPRMVKEPAAPPPANVGAISPQQAAQLIRLAEIMRGAAQRLAEAQRVAEWATADYQRYVESLTVNS